MIDDWRVTVSLRGRPRWKRRPARHAIVGGLRGRLGDDASGGGTHVTSGGRRIFVYARTADAALRARRAAREVLAECGTGADVRLARWDPVRRTWQDAATELPDEAEQSLRDAHEYLMEQQRADSVATGRAAWQVRVALARHGAEPLAELLEAEGWPVILQRKYLIAGANCEDDATALARRIRSYTPMDVDISVEPVVSLPWWLTAGG